MKKELLFRKLPAFTLTELLVVLAIIGILVLLVLPDQSSVITKTKTTEAKLQLEALYSMQLAYFYEHSRYSESLEEIGFNQQPLATDGGAANYRIEITESSPQAFKARATSVVDFDHDGQFNAWEIDQGKKLKEVIKD